MREWAGSASWAYLPLALSHRKLLLQLFTSNESSQGSVEGFFLPGLEIDLGLEAGVIHQALRGQ